MDASNKNIAWDSNESTTIFFQSLLIEGGVVRERAGVLSDFLSQRRNCTTGYQAQRARTKVCFRGSFMGVVTNQDVVIRLAKLLADVALGKLSAASARFYGVSFAGWTR